MYVNRIIWQISMPRPGWPLTSLRNASNILSVVIMQGVSCGLVLKIEIVVGEQYARQKKEEKRKSERNQFRFVTGWADEIPQKTPSLCPKPEAAWDHSDRERMLQEHQKTHY